jgi:hypothetical protein
LSAFHFSLDLRRSFITRKQILFSAARADMDFSQFVASGAAAITEGAVVERIRRDPAIALDPHILNGGLIYDSAGRARLAEIHSEYMLSARAARLPILTFTDTWRCSQWLVEASRFRGRPVNEDNARFLIDLRRTLGGDPPLFVGGLIGPSGDAYKPTDSEWPPGNFIGLRSRRSPRLASISCFWRQRPPWTRRSA